MIVPVRELLDVSLSPILHSTGCDSVQVQHYAALNLMIIIFMSYRKTIDGLWGKRKVKHILDYTKSEVQEYHLQPDRSGRTSVVPTMLISPFAKEIRKVKAPATHHAGDMRLVTATVSG
jgi:hypothetical protein